MEKAYNDYTEEQLDYIDQMCMTILHLMNHRSSFNEFHVGYAEVNKSINFLYQILNQKKIEFQNKNNNA